jgi:hypothetical protein
MMDAVVCCNKLTEHTNTMTCNILTQTECDGTGKSKTILKIYQYVKGNKGNVAHVLN